ncbi:hypothetical protein CYMTET_31870, partial [Cymbomonas tetramitiformis]
MWLGLHTSHTHVLSRLFLISAVLPTALSAPQCLIAANKLARKYHTVQQEGWRNSLDKARRFDETLESLNGLTAHVVALDEKLRAQETLLHWVIKELNSTQRRLEYTEAVLRETRREERLVQSRVLCEGKGEWQGEERGCACFQGHGPACKDFHSTTSRFSFTGATNAWIVPNDGTTHLAMAVWGAGGGASPYAECSEKGCWGEGGAGGFGSGTLEAHAGQVLQIVVGEGGRGSPLKDEPRAEVFGFGGTAFKEGGGGGGLTGIFDGDVQHNRSILIAGG